MTPVIPLNVATITLAVLLLTNLAALVWGAATISRTVGLVSLDSTSSVAGRAAGWAATR